MQKLIKVKVCPRSSRNEIVGELPDGTIKVKLTAPPVDGEANKKLIEFLSEALGLARGKIKILRGATNRTKIIAIDN